MAQLSRRELLSGLAAGSLLSSFPSSSAQAVEPVTVALFCASAVLSFMGESGDLQKELEAVNLKMDQILANQSKIMDALAAIDSRLDDIQKSVENVPSETIGLDLVIRCGHLARSIMLAIKDVKARPGEQRAVKIYLDARDNLFDVAGLLTIAIQNTNRPPSLVIAAQHNLNSLKLIKRHEDQVGGITDTDRGRLKEMARNTLWSMQAMSGPNGISMRLPPTIAKIEECRTELSKLTTATVLLPKNFGSSIRGSGPLPLTRVGETKLCAFHKTPDSVRRSQVKFFLDKLIAYGGRSLYDITPEPKESWSLLSWKRMLMIVAPVIVGPVTPDERLAGCSELALEENGFPAEFRQTYKLLGAYNSLAAIESRLLSLQSTAEDGSISAQKIYDEI